MSVTAAPGATFEAVAANFATGLTGTIGVRLIDNAGATTTVRATTGIAEYPAGSGIYAKTMTAPSVAGQYTIVWDNGATTPGNVATEDLVVTYTAASSSTSSVYATSAELKYALDASGGTYMDNDVSDALNAASRAIDEACGRRFYPTTETRVYTPDLTNWTGYTTTWAKQSRTLDIDDLNALTTLKVDTNGDGTYETTWAVGTDFYLDPPNAAVNGYPYERVVLTQSAGRIFPLYDNSVQVIGSFGWAETPPEVKTYCKIFAAQLLLRSRQAPFGVLMAGIEVGTSARISRFDPDFDRLLGHLVKPRQIIA